MDLSVIIVNYNTYEYTKNCIESVLNADDDLNGERLEFEVILVDNASKDGSIEWLEKEYNDEPKVLIIKNDENLGFSAANNIGLQEAQGTYLLLLNSDTVIEPDALVKTIGFMDNHPECEQHASSFMLQKSASRRKSIWCDSTTVPSVISNIPSSFLSSIRTSYFP